jgi:hypothetical protein
MASSGRSQATNTSILNFILGKAAYTAPAGAYVALFSATPTNDQGPWTELTGGNYARAPIGAGTNLPADWTSLASDATGTHKTNTAAITFPTASAGWTAATGYGIYDSSSAGTLLYWGTFGSATTVGSGATASFAAQALVVTEA